MRWAFLLTAYGMYTARQHVHNAAAMSLTDKKHKKRNLIAGITFVLPLAIVWVAGLVHGYRLQPSLLLKVGYWRIREDAYLRPNPLGHEDTTIKAAHITTGGFAVDIPGEIELEDDPKCTVSIAAGTFDQLKDQGFLHPTEVSKYMRIKVDAGNHFKVTMVTPEEQKMNLGTPTVWLFRLAPKKVGRASVEVLFGFTDAAVDVPSFRPSYSQDVTVTEGFWKHPAHFFKENWKWIASTIFIPLLFVWVNHTVDKRDKKKEAEKKEQEQDDDIA